VKILVTGTAGFIGSHLAHRLLDRGDEVIGVDNVNDYYDVSLKEARLKRLTGKQGFTEVRRDVADRQAMEAVFKEHQPERVVHLAAQAGVRYSIENPHAYIDANLVGFTNILEGCRHNGVKHLVLPPAVRYTVPTRLCRFRFMTTLTIRSAFTRRRKKPMS